MTTRATHQVEQAGRRLHWLACGLMAVTPAAIAVVLARRGPLALLSVPPGIEILEGGWSSPRALAAVALGLLVPAAWLVALIQLDRLFRLYVRGIVFSRENVAAIRRVGWVLLAIDPIAMLRTMLTGPVLTLVGATRGFLVIELHSSILIVGLFVVLVSRVMDMGRVLHEDDQLTV